MLLRLPYTFIILVHPYLYYEEQLNLDDTCHLVQRASCDYLWRSEAVVCGIAYQGFYHNLARYASFAKSFRRMPSEIRGPHAESAVKELMYWYLVRGKFILADKFIHKLNDSLRPMAKKIDSWVYHAYDSGWVAKAQAIGCRFSFHVFASSLFAQKETLATELWNTELDGSPDLKDISMILSVSTDWADKVLKKFPIEPIPMNTFAYILDQIKSTQQVCDVASWGFKSRFVQREVGPFTWAMIHLNWNRVYGILRSVFFNYWDAV